MVAVTAGTQKSRLWASSRIGSSAENAFIFEPDIRCGHTVHAHARASRASKSGGRKSSMPAQSAIKGHWPPRNNGSPNMSRTRLGSR